MICEEELRTWFRRKYVNIGLLTGRVNGIVVVDKDTKAAARQFWREAQCAMVAETLKGAHFYFRHPGYDVPNVKIEDGDLRGERGQAVAPPSVIAGWKYRWVRGPVVASLLTPFRDEWLPPKKEVKIEDYEEIDTIRRISRAAAYAQAIDQADSGSAGDCQAFWFACAMIQRFSLTVEQAWPIALSWNLRNVPPMSERALLRKLREAERLKK